MGSAQERALLMETLDALRKRHTAQAHARAHVQAQRGVPAAWGAWETGSACSEPVE